MSNSIRVAHIIGKMNGGGVEAVVMNYYRHIDRNKVQFDFLVDADSKLVPQKEIEGLGGRVFEIPPYQHVGAHQHELKRLFGQGDWQIVHSHINALSVLPLHAAKKAGVPVRIAHSHSSNGGGKGEGAKDVAKGLLRRFSRRCPTHALACSHVAGDWLFGLNSDYTVMPNAVDVSLYAPNSSLRAAARGDLGIFCSTFVVGHIGRMAPPKNHMRLLSIFKELTVLEPNSLLLLAGEGPLLSEVRHKAADLGIGDQVHFLGQRADSAMLYQAFDVFCLPSVYEGLPMVGVECQAAGTPILASDAVTKEAAMTSLMEFESLESSSRLWAEHLVNMRGMSPVEEDAEKLVAFDVRSSAAILLKYYEECLKEVVR